MDGISLSGNAIPRTVKSAPTKTSEPVRRLSLENESNRSEQPTSMTRAKVWSLEVENAFRFQLAGFTDEAEYLDSFPEPEKWESSGMIKVLRAKATGYFMYFRQYRECEDKHLNKVKLYSY